MNCFQFDECSSSSELIRECKKEGLCSPRKYPNKHRSLKDPEMLDIYMKRNGVLITFDLSIVEDNDGFIPLENPGIILIGQSANSMRTMTITSARKIMKSFKRLFPEWCKLSWRNSIVAITDATISAGCVTNSGFYVEFSTELNDTDEGWKESLRDFLTQNSSR
jgi:hypothetical protein